MRLVRRAARGDGTSWRPDGQAPLHQVGSEPDYRFSLANERTFLAWLRTALALLAGGVAVVSLVPDIGTPAIRRVIGVALLLLAGMVAGASYRRWAASERALRLERPLPRSSLPLLVASGVTAVIAVLLVLVALGT